MEPQINLDLLGLTKRERLILLMLQEGSSTPLLLSRQTRVSRPAIYVILQNLKKRGLVVSRIVNGKKHWELSSNKKIEEALYETKRSLLKIPLGRQEIHGLSDSSVIVYRGKEAIRAMFFQLFDHHRNENLSGVQGNVSAIGWDKTFSVAETNQINQKIKTNGIIVKGILPEHWFEEQTKLLGVGWAKDFEGRAMRANVIDPKYFKNAGQVWIFKNSLFLMALNEELVIEVRNSEIQKCLLEIFEYIHDTAPIIDANELLRNLIAEGEKEKVNQPKA